MSPDDREAWLHLWKVIGTFLGVNEALYPATVEEGHALMEAIRQSQWQESEQGKALATSLCDCIASYFTLEVPGEETVRAPLSLVGHLPAALIRHQAGDRCADLLGLPPARFERLLVDLAAELEHMLGPFEDHLPSVFQLLSLRLMKAVVDVQREGKETGFRIPPALLRAWNLDD